MPDIDYWLGRKYAILQQQADATTNNAASTAIASLAAADVDRTRASLLPAESRAGVAKTGAETKLLGEQAGILGPESLARIAQMRAETGLVGTNTAIAKRKGLDELTILPESLSAIMGTRGYQGYRLPTETMAPRRPAPAPGEPDYRNLFRY